MRVLTFLHSFEPGGVERVALRLVRHWRGQGVDAPLFLGRREGAMADDVGRGLDVTMPAQPRIATRHWETLWMILTLPRAIRTLRPDVLFCAGNTYAVVAVAMKLLLGRGCPPILAKVSNDLDRRTKPWPRRMVYRLWLRVQGQFIDHFVGMEAPMAAEIAEHIGVGDGRVSIIPDPALSIDLIDRLRISPRVETAKAVGRRFVAVGRLAGQKNLALMLRAFQCGARPGDSLTMFGDGPDRTRLERLAARLGIGDRVAFRGYVAEPAAQLPQFDVLLLSSDYEGVPAVILEALAANLWIIATDCSRSMATLLRRGSLGALVPVGDEAAFAGAIAQASGNRQDRVLSLAQAERFTVEYSSDAYLKALVRLIPPRVPVKNVLAAG